MNQWALWLQIIDDCGDARFGFWAFELFGLKERVEAFGLKLNEISAEDYDGLQVVKTEISKRRAYKDWETAEKTKAN